MAACRQGRTTAREHEPRQPPARPGRQRTPAPAPAAAGGQYPVHPGRLRSEGLDRAAQCYTAAVDASVAGLAGACPGRRPAGNRPGGVRLGRRYRPVRARQPAWLARGDVLAPPVAVRAPAESCRDGGDPDRRDLPRPALTLAPARVRRASSAGGLSADVDVRHAVGLGSAVSPVPARVDLACSPEVPPVEVGKKRVEEDKLGIGRLPDPEVGRPLLAPGPYEQVDIAEARLVQVPRGQLLVDLVSAQL